MDKLLDLFLEFRACCPRYAEYQHLYAHCPRLQTALSAFYATLVRFCAKTVQVVQRPGFVHLIKASVKPFESEFESFSKLLRAQKEDINDEIQLAAGQAAEQERRMQIIEREEAGIYRKHGTIFRNRMYDSNREAKDWRLQYAQRNSRAQKQRLLDQLSKYDHLASLKRARKKRYRTTSSWLKETRGYQEWAEAQESSAFLLTGIVGSGKTVATTVIIEDLCYRKSQMSDQTTVSYLFCESDRADSLDARTVLGCLIRQALSIEMLDGCIQKALADLFKDGDPDVEELQNLFIEVVKMSQSYWVVIDGLDECLRADREAILTVLRKVQRASRSPLKVFLSAREDIRMDIESIIGSYRHQAMSCDAATSDISSYVKDVLADRLARKELVVGDPTLVPDIQNALVQGAQGMFLWVALQILDICKQTCDKNIRKAIKTLPKDLPETYEWALARVLQNRKAEVARRVYRWVAAARRPLSLDELREAIAVEPGQADLQPDSLVNNIEQMIAWCGNLVVVDEDEHLVQFAHHSVKDYLLSQSANADMRSFQFRPSEVDYEAGEICVTYLSFNHFKRQLAKRPKPTPAIDPKQIVATTLSNTQNPVVMKSWSKLERLWKTEQGRKLDLSDQFSALTDAQPTNQSRLQYSFLQYACDYWLAHTTRLSEQSPAWKPWKQLVESDNCVATRPWTADQWTSLDKPVLRYILDHDHVALVEARGLSGEDFKFFTQKQFLLHSASMRGLTELFERILKSKRFLRSTLSLSLQAAAARGSPSIVEGLLNLNMDLNARDATDGASALTALQAACEGGHLDVVERLLSAHADINAPAAAQHARTALQAAPGAGQMEIVELLLQHGAGYDAQAAPIDGRAAAMQAACKGGHLEVVERLLRAKVDANAPATELQGRTALQAAAEVGRMDIVELLLQLGADVNAEATSFNGRTALQAACGGGHLNVVKRLLIADADINAPTVEYRGRTALQAAAGAGHTEIVELLLHHHASVYGRAAEVGGCTALQAACGAGHLKVVKRLLEAAAILKEPGWQRESLIALDAAAEAGHLDVVTLLLAEKVDVFGTLTFACRGGHLHVAKRLVEAGAPLVADWRPADGDTTLLAAARCGSMELVSWLVDKGANFESFEDGSRALHAAARAGHLGVVDQLLTLKIKAKVRVDKEVDCPDRQRQTALHAAAEAGHLNVVERLLAANADHRIYGRYSQSPLQAAAAGGYAETVKRLLKAGSNANDKLGSRSGSRWAGRTTLGAAAEGGHLAVVEILLAAGAGVQDYAGPLDDYADRSPNTTALQMAAIGGHLDVVERLLKAGAVDDSYSGRKAACTAVYSAAKRGKLDIVGGILAVKLEARVSMSEVARAALEAAAGAGNLWVVEWLLEEYHVKVDLSRRHPSSDYGPLQAAAGGGHLDVVERLLRANADVNADAEFPNVLLGAAEVEDLTRDRYARYTALQLAVVGGHLEIVNRLLQAGANVTDGKNGHTILQAAAASGHLEIMDLLLRAGAKADADKHSALQIAAERGHLEIVDRLLNVPANVDIDIDGQYGHIMLQAAAADGHLKILDRLLEAGANFHSFAEGYRGESALRAAAAGGHLEVVDRLLRAGATVHSYTEGKNGDTALQAAAAGGHLRVVDWLLRAGATVNGDVDFQGGRTALQSPAAGGRLKVVKRLMSAGADVNAGPSEEERHTALWHAVRNNNLEVARRFLLSGALIDDQTSRIAAKGNDLHMVELLLNYFVSDLDLGYPPKLLVKARQRLRGTRATP